MLVLTRMSSLNMVDGNKQKHLLPSFATKESGNLFFEKLINIKVILFLEHEVFK